MCPGRAGAGEGDEVDIGSHQCLTLLGVAVDHLQDSLGKLLHQQFGVGLRHQWGLL